MSSNAHLFAFLLPNLTVLARQSTIKITNEELIYRLFGIVRKHIGDQVVFFDDSHHATATLTECNKRFAVVELDALKQNLVLQPVLTVALGLTKKPAFEEALYSCAAMGVSQVIPLLSAQVERNWFGPKEIARLERIATTAREQAKNYSPLTITLPQTLPELLQQPLLTENAIYKMVLEKQAPTLDAQLPAIKKAAQMLLVFGPEGGLLPEELELLAQHGFLSQRLVASTLRTQEAVTVAVGAIRSLTLSQNPL